MHRLKRYFPSFYFLTVLGLVILRVKEPELSRYATGYITLFAFLTGTLSGRPYKTWITTPLIFCAVALFLLLMPIIAAPLEALAVLGTIKPLTHLF